MLLPLNKQPDMLQIFRSSHLENVPEAIERSSVDLDTVNPCYQAHHQKAKGYNKTEAQTQFMHLLHFIYLQFLF